MSRGDFLSRESRGEVPRGDVLLMTRGELVPLMIRGELSREIISEPSEMIRGDFLFLVGLGEPFVSVELLLRGELSVTILLLI